ncbi:FAD/NAD(P)-binding protein [Nocardioides marmoraquaticus]
MGAGAGGALAATHLVTALSPRHRVVLVDPGETTGRGAAYSTTDERHLLNVPASGMTAFPRDPEHFFRWVRRHRDPEAQPQHFVPRRWYGDYVEGLLETAAEYPGNAGLERRRARVTDVARRGTRFVVRDDQGGLTVARAVVLAGGTPSGSTWAPDELRGSARFVSDPWTQPLPDGDLLLVGTGLTMVDVAVSADRPGRTLHTVSRHDVLPRVHRVPTTPPVPPPPGITRLGSLAELREAVATHVERTVAATGDWRPAIDGLRPVTAQLWSGLSEDEKQVFVSEHARAWDVHRHRMSPEVAARLREITEAGRLERHAGTVTGVREVEGGLEVDLSDGATVTVAGVVSCTGPVGTIAHDPLLTTLAREGVVRPGPLGIGVDVADDGRVRGVLPSTMPIYALGSLRRGSLWETTAMPEIREQAYNVAQRVVRALHGETRRRPTDVYGLCLTTTGTAARSYNDALGRLLRLQDGAERGLREAVQHDPDFVQAQAAIALLGHEWGTSSDWGRALDRAHAAAARRSIDDREVSFLRAVTTRLRSDEATGAAALLRHVRLFPRDALAVSVAVPTVAFGGLTSGTQTAALVESLGRSYGDDWWYAGQLAFVRQDQARWEEAEELAAYALSVEPSSGHAVHARTHVFYETGRHADGLRWLDGWIDGCGRQANHRSHFSWHAALHELMQDDVDAVRRRYARQLAPPGVSGSRALVDSGALLWRCHVTGTWDDDLPAREVSAAAPTGWLTGPPTPFAAMHAALTLAAEGDETGLAMLRTTASAHLDPVFRDVVAPLCGALADVVEGRYAAAGAGPRALLPRAGALGGSAAQREVLEDTLVHALARSGDTAAAAVVLERRLDRRASPLDARRRAALAGVRQEA